ncbi:MAG: glycosyltransferase family 2 protein [Bacteroidia bacterium]|nr:glycosyltransferase family 2 protein [Bacteroidia bacterium]
MNGKFLVSIIVLTYNSDFYKIIRTLESIVLQTYKKFEIIISDDGSSSFQANSLEHYFKENEITNYKSQFQNGL